MKLLYCARCGTPLMSASNLALLREQVTREPLALSLEEKRELVKFIERMETDGRTDRSRGGDV